MPAYQGPEDLGAVISWDTRTADFQPESLNKLGLAFGMWPHQLYWLLHDRYCMPLSLQLGGCISTARCTVCIFSGQVSAPRQSLTSRASLDCRSTLA